MAALYLASNNPNPGRARRKMRARLRLVRKQPESDKWEQARLASDRAWAWIVAYRASLEARNAG